MPRFLWCRQPLRSDALAMEEEEGSDGDSSQGDIATLSAIVVLHRKGVKMTSCRHFQERGKAGSNVKADPYDQLNFH